LRPARLVRYQAHDVYLLYALAVTFAFLLLWPVLLLHPKVRHGVVRGSGLSAGLPARRARASMHGASAGDLLALADGRQLKRRLPAGRS
jgi:hypothetical protein